VVDVANSPRKPARIVLCSPQPNAERRSSPTTGQTSATDHPATKSWLKRRKRNTRWEVKIKKEKQNELEYYDSPLFQLLRKTVRNLARIKAVKKQQRKLDWGACPFRSLMWIENVPETVAKKLEQKFEKYVERQVRRKPHPHLWKFEGETHGVFWLTCADEQCDAEAQLLLTDSLGMVQNIILPYYRATQQGKTIYKTRPEQKRINKFLTDYKEEAMREGIHELEKELIVYQKLLEASLGKANELKIQRRLQRLERDRKDWLMAMLVL